jgi:hypothetical protein
MNRTTRLSLIAVMLLAATALGVIAYTAMNPPTLPPPPKEEPQQPPPQPAVYPEAPRPNPVYVELQVNFERHQQHCLQLGSMQMEAVIVLDSKSQSQTTADQRVKECWSLLEIERKYVENFPAKTIQ